MSLKEALTNPEEISRRQREYKRQVWESIKTHHPEHAAFIEQVTERFGKLERVTVTSDDGTVLDSDRQSKEQE